MCKCIRNLQGSINVERGRKILTSMVALEVLYIISYAVADAVIFQPL